MAHRVSMETSIHGRQLVPMETASCSYPCFHGNSHSPAQNVDVETTTRIGIVFMTLC